MALETYRAKRDFATTPEPEGTAPKASARAGRFVIQKHAARRLHYDFRLEKDGVLLSWAVTRGPSLDPGEKRLAVHVEDHPVEYGDFEGTIPKGEYGGGAVVLWDRGSWTPIGDAGMGLAKGHLDFELDGEKLHGRWHLVRMARRGREKRDNWLLIKGADAFARGPGDPDILDEAPGSVKTGRDIAEVAAGEGAEAEPEEEPAARKPGHGRAAAVAMKGARKDKRAAEIVHETAAMTRPPAPKARAAARLTHPDRIYWADAGVTKQGLAEYYALVWPRMAPFVTGRPLALLRCPGGTAKTCFFQKHAWKGLSRDILTAPDPMEDPDDPGEIVAIDGLEGVIGLVQGAALEIHAWQAALTDLERPDQIVMDLDPGEGVGWPALAAAARAVRGRLEDAGLAAFVKSSGGKGLHVVAPLEPAAGWEAVKDFAKGIAEAMAGEAPESYVATVAKARRQGRILIDYLRNGRGATAVAPYSSRARPGAPVAMPLGWEEIDALGPGWFTVTNAPARLNALEADPWEGFRAAAVALPEARARWRRR